MRTSRRTSRATSRRSACSPAREATAAPAARALRERAAAITRRTCGPQARARVLPGRVGTDLHHRRRPPDRPRARALRRRQRVRRHARAGAAGRRRGGAGAQARRDRRGHRARRAAGVARRWSRWRDLPAARTQSLFVVDADRLHRAGPRFVDGMADLCEALDRARARARRIIGLSCTMRQAASVSKAFTSEEAPEDDDELPDDPSPLPAGARNYMTPGGFARLRDELDQLVQKERPGARVGRVVGGRQRRPLGERRLPVRQEAAARDRPAHPLPHPAPRPRGGRRSRRAARRRRRSRLLRRDGRRRRHATGASARSASSASTRSTPRAATSAGSRRWRARS